MPYYVIYNTGRSASIYKYTDTGTFESSQSIATDSATITADTTRNRLYVYEYETGPDEIKVFNPNTLSQITSETITNINPGTGTDARITGMAVFGGTIWLLHASGLLTAYSLTTKAKLPAVYRPFGTGSTGFWGLVVTSTYFWIAGEGDVMYAVNATGASIGQRDRSKDFALPASVGFVQGLASDGTNFILHDTTNQIMYKTAIPS